MSRAQDIGIKAIELYFPSQCVDQAELEKFDGVSEGKYTIGLGQTKMSFCDDREDMYSLALTTVSSLLKKYNIDPTSIGRMEVGTETLLDKSKSVKTVLMQLFQDSGNTNIEGVDTVNACYGGTNALFNTVNWMESSAWDGRDAIVVAGDIALYKKGNARPTGGAGCVAMLVGPNAPVVVEPGLRGSYLIHAYDFYKPDLTSEYPVVDGHFSLQCYTEAVDACYKAYNAREKTLQHAGMMGNTTNGADMAVDGHLELNGNANGHSTLRRDSLKRKYDNIDGAVTSNGALTPPEPAPAKQLDSPMDRFDHMCFHAPTCKLVSKSYARLLYNDFLADPSNPIFESVPQELRNLDYKSSLTDKTLEKHFMGMAKKKFEARIRPGMQVPTMCGNMYCASVYASLVSLFSNVDSDDLQGRRIALFSYGSGLASSLFSFRVKGSTRNMAEKVDLQRRLAERNQVAPEVYDEMCNLRERAHLKKSYQPQGGTEHIAKGTYYLTGIDDMFRRSYDIKS